MLYYIQETGMSRGERRRNRLGRTSPSEPVSEISFTFFQNVSRETSEMFHVKHFERR